MLSPVDPSLDLSISIVSYNVRDLLDECLRSIAAQTRGVRYEIIVVDNGSADGTVEMLRRNHPSARVITNRVNLGFAAAQNIGLRAGRGRYLYALDSDTYLKTDAFAEMVRFMDEQPSAGAAGARLLSPDGTRQYNRRNFPPSLWPILYRGTVLKRILPPSPSVVYYEMSDATFQRPGEVDWLYGGNVILRRQAILEAGLFDERFFIYCEDIDLGYRFQRAGWRRFFIPQAEIFHYGAQGTGQIAFRSYWRHVRSFVKLFHKYNWRLDEVCRTSLAPVDQPVDLCITIVNYNSRALLDRCLASITSHAPQCRHRIIVVDNGSGDGSLDLVRERYRGVDWIANRNNLGYARAVNQAIRQVRANFFLLLNPDVEIGPGSIDELLGFMGRTPSAGIAGAKLFYPNGELQHSARRFYTLPALLWRRTFLGKLFPDARINREHLMANWDHGTEQQVDWLLGTSMLIRRSAADDVGLMDERYFLYFEDVDWCYRFHCAGWGVHYVPQSRMVHQHLRESSHRGLSRVKLEHLKSLLLFIVKHRGLVHSPADPPRRRQRPQTGPLAGLRIAIVHDYMTQYGGAERLLEILHRCFPDAAIHTLVRKRHFRWMSGAEIPRGAVRTSFIQWMPGSAFGEFREYLGLLPAAIEAFDFDGYDIVISNSSAWAKGIITGPHTTHVCYLLSPMRFVWTWHEETLRAYPRPVRDILGRVLSRIKEWDIASSRRPDLIATVSREVQGRIRSFYRRESEVIHPGIDCTFFSPGSTARGDHYLVVSRLKPYKRIDVAVRAFTALGKRLVVAGDGPERRRLQRLAGPTVAFLGRISDGELRDHYRRCRALVFPTHEDFGLTPLEAQACGTPVIAYGGGGALETVVDGRTGLFFGEQTPESLAAALRRFEAMGFDQEEIRRHALQFDQAIFAGRLMEFIERAARRREGRIS